MAPLRFRQVSRYRNAVLSHAKPDERYSELSLGSLPDSGVGKLLAISPVSSHIFARSSISTNSLIIIPVSATRKYGKQPPILHNVSSGGQLGDFDLCQFQDGHDQVLLACGSLQGDITLQLVRLPSSPGPDLSTSVVLPPQESTSSIFKTPTAKPINLVAFHPTCSSLFLTASNQENNINIWDANKSSPVLHFEEDGPQWDAKWSPDGCQLAAFGKDAKVRIWDPRNTKDNVVTINAHTSKVKPGKVTFIKASQSHLLLTTGFSQMRQREITIYDQRNSSSPLRRITLDVGSSALEPVCDYDRGIVYMVAKGESSIRWVDVGSEDQGGNFAEGAHALNFATTSAALGPAVKCDTGVGEIAKLYIGAAGGSGGGASAADSIIPASIRVPRRTYIDFHSDLYPLTSDRRGTGLKASEWLEGVNGSLPLLTLDPSSSGQASKFDVAHSSGSSHIMPANIHPTSQASPSKDEVVAQKSSPKAEDERKPPSTINSAAAIPEAKVSAHANTTAASQIASLNYTEPERTKATPPALAPAVTSPHWSRRFLGGSTPLIPSFQNLTSLDISRAPAAKMLTVSTHYFFIPLAGPGGRLGIHSLQKEGRLPLQMPSFSHGAPLGDFVVDPFHQDQIITSAADGMIRLWKIPPLPAQGEDWPINLAEQPLTLTALPINEGSNKVAELCPHPHTDGLVAVIPADVDGKIHLINVREGHVVKSVGVPAHGLYSAVWSPDGSVLAGSGKDRNLYILDIRGKSPVAFTLGQAPAHDSPRPFSIVWIDDVYLLTVGHTTGSLRQIKLFAIDCALENSLTEVAKYNLDVSPSILHPFWDPDVNVLWLWSKGERLISTFEVQPDNVKEPFLALTAFQHNQPQLGLAFMRKDCVKVREVEVASSIRLCKEELQKVAWSITRSRPEYFQDDIYRPTVVIEKPLLKVEEWIGGRDAQNIPTKSLQPKGMMPLSQAPAVVRTSKLPKGPLNREKTDEEREEEMLTSIFEKAKGNDEGKDPNHNEDQAARAPDEDDWGSD